MLPGIVEIPGAQRGHPVLSGGDRRLELHLLGPQAGQALLAGRAARGRGRRDSRPGRPPRGPRPSPRRGRAARPRGPRPPPSRPPCRPPARRSAPRARGRPATAARSCPGPRSRAGRATTAGQSRFGCTWPGRGSLAREPVAGIEAPEAAVAVDPAVLVADDRRRPLHVAAGPDGPAVARGRSRRTGRSAPASPGPPGRPGPAGRACRARAAAGDRADRGCSVRRGTAAA